MGAMVDPSTTWMLTNGSTEDEASVLNPALLCPFVSHSPPMDSADQTHTFTINETGLTTWTLNGSSYQEAKVPILQGNSSAGWMADTTIHMPYNSTIDIIMRIANTSIDMVRSPDRDLMLRVMKANANVRKSDADGPSYAHARS